MIEKTRLALDVPIYFVLGSISKHFGGMTTASLRRASEFINFGHRDVTILTTQPHNGENVEETRRRLVEQGFIPENVRLRNLWTELRTMPDTVLQYFGSPGMNEENQALDHLKYQNEWESNRFNELGDLLQVDRFRADGTRFASDRRDMVTKGVLGGRLVSLYARSGDIVGQWTRVTSLITRWLDLVTNKRLSAVIIDSKFVANLLYDYRRNHLVMGRVLHSHHLAEPMGDSDALVSSLMPAALTHDSLDFVIALTEHQRQDLLKSDVLSDNVEVIPNISPLEPVRRLNYERDPLAGVVIARLSPTKRIDHIVKAVSILHKRGIPISLDIYGEGPTRDVVQEVIDANELGQSVFLRGHDSNAREVFKEASFSVLASKYEGQGLVILESMAGGCIPVSYDIEYGPSDIISDGRDGKLAKAGHIQSLADAIESVVTMNKLETRRMRKRALKRSYDFQAEPIVERWMETIQKGIDSKEPSTKIKMHAQLMAATETEKGWQLEIHVVGERVADSLWFKLMWSARDRSQFRRISTENTLFKGGVAATATLDVTPLERLSPRGADIFVDTRVGTIAHRMRVKVADSVELPRAVNGIHLFRTSYGNLSAKQVPLASTSEGELLDAQVLTQTEKGE